MSEFENGREIGEVREWDILRREREEDWKTERLKDLEGRRDCKGVKLEK